jgi:hypothetical protein
MHFISMIALAEGLLFSQDKIYWTPFDFPRGGENLEPRTERLAQETSRHKECGLAPDFGGGLQHYV